MVEPLPTHVAHAEYGDNWFRGHSVSHELASTETWFGIVVLGVTGRRLNQSEIGVLDDLGLALTVADPRIWPLKLTRLVSAYGSTLAGLAAGALSLEEARIGHWSTGEAARFLHEIRNATNGPDDMAGIEAACRARLDSRAPLMGFGVPFRPFDERLVIYEKCVAARGRDKLDYWRLFKNVADVLYRLKGIRPNIGGGGAAVCLDLGFSERETAIVFSFLGLSDFLANATESAVQKPAIMQSLDPSSIRYVGHPPRESGRR